MTDEFIFFLKLNFCCKKEFGESKFKPKQRSRHFSKITVINKQIQKKTYELGTWAVKKPMC